MRKSILASIIHFSTKVMKRMQQVACKLWANLTLVKESKLIQSSFSFSGITGDIGRLY